jgi:hypothetical protein
MGNSNSGVDAFLLGVGVESELVLLTLELELEWSFENIDGVGVAYPRTCPSLIQISEKEEILNFWSDHQMQTLKNNFSKVKLVKK